MHYFLWPAKLAKSNSCAKTRNSIANHGLRTLKYIQLVAYYYNKQNLTFAFYKCRKMLLTMLLLTLSKFYRDVIANECKRSPVPDCIEVL